MIPDPGRATPQVQRVSYHLDAQGIPPLALAEIEIMLRGADDLIMRGGRHFRAKLLKGSRGQAVLHLGLERSPAYGAYRHLSLEQALARIDYVILNGYRVSEYDNRLPLLKYTAASWEIEQETSSPHPFDMTYRKDRHRGLIMLLLDTVEATGDPQSVPLLEAWAPVDYQTVKQRIMPVMHRLNPAPG